MLPNYDEKYVAQLFDQMGPTYDTVNLISSFGFSELWRAQCVGNLPIQKGAIVTDLMAGSGECWTYLRRRIESSGEIISVDFSGAMCRRQADRKKQFPNSKINIVCENALSLSLPDNSVDFVISAFGLKTFDSAQLDRLAAEMYRFLRSGGGCSLLEISLPNSRILRSLYCLYVNSVIPAIGRIFLKDIQCYKMLGIYTEAFGSCSRVVEHFQKAGFQVEVKNHFFGCASSITAMK